MRFSPTRAVITAVALGASTLYARAPAASGSAAASGVPEAAGDLPGAAQQDRVAEKMLRAGMMLPAGKPRPDVATVQAFGTALETADANLAAPYVHRLNRAEYRNAVGLDIDVSQLLPADDSSRGFDNQAGPLIFSPPILDAFLSAASRFTRSALGIATTATQASYRVADDTTQNYPVDGLTFETRGGLAPRTPVAAGTTVHQVTTAQIGTGNLLPSVQLAVEDPEANSSNCGEGYSCVYTNTISWAAPTRTLPMEINPQTVFERMFGDGSSPKERRARRSSTKSILDSVSGSLKRLMQKLGAIKVGDGTLLDHSLILFGSNMGYSNQHLHYDVAAVLVGGAGGRLKGDRHLAYASRSVPTGNLLLSILDMFDVKADHFGDSTGRLANI